MFESVHAPQAALNRQGSFPNTGPGDDPRGRRLVKSLDHDLVVAGYALLREPPGVRASRRVSGRSEGGPGYVRLLHPFLGPARGAHPEVERADQTLVRVHHRIVRSGVIPEHW